MMLYFYLPRVCLLQYDLNELLAAGFQVRQQAQLLEHVDGEVLRFIDDDDGVTSRRVTVEQMVIEFIDQNLD